MSLVLRIWLALACAVPIMIVWALIIALVSRFRWKVSQWFLPMFAGPFVFVFLVVVFDILGGAPFKFENARAFWYYMGTTSYGSATGMTVAAGAILAHFVATVILPYYGLWRTQSAVPAARQWSLKRLSLWLLGSLGCLLLTLMLQSWIVCRVARQTIQQIAADAKGWMPAGAVAGPQKAVESPKYLDLLDEVSRSTNPSFKIGYSAYVPLKASPVRTEIEYGNKLARLHVEAMEVFLKETPFHPANSDPLTWDRRELAGFRKIQNAARLATIIAIEEGDHERVIRYINTLALCSDQLRVYSDAACLVQSMLFAETRSALLERWLAEAAPASPLVARIKPLKLYRKDFASHRETMLRQLEATILYEHARMLVGSKPWSGDESRVWLVKEASKTSGDPTRFLDRVMTGADCQLRTPEEFEKHRGKYLVPVTELTNRAHDWVYSERARVTRLTWMAFPTFSALCYRLAVEDARELNTSVALQVELFRQKEKKYPESLEQLVPRYLQGLPVDPFIGKALGYLREGEGGAIVYCVGADHLDQQVDPKFQGSRMDADIVFCLGSSYLRHRIPKLE
ncbi:MAG: hypothetical protein JWN70_1956 [Planctomycetaceae bacterium]|nr:hypothetical protein [Planctomycetaceae bacterium]